MVLINFLKLTLEETIIKISNHQIQYLISKKSSSPKLDQSNPSRCPRSFEVTSDLNLKAISIFDRFGRFWPIQIENGPFLTVLVIFGQFQIENWSILTVLIIFGQFQIENGPFLTVLIIFCQFQIENGPFLTVLVIFGQFRIENANFTSKFKILVLLADTLSINFSIFKKNVYCAAGHVRECSTIFE